MTCLPVRRLCVPGELRCDHSRRDDDVASPPKKVLAFLLFRKKLPVPPRNIASSKVAVENESTVADHENRHMGRDDRRSAHAPRSWPNILGLPSLLLGNMTYQ